MPGDGKIEVRYSETGIHVACRRWEGSDASERLLCVAAQDLQAQGDVIDPSQGVDADVASKERHVKDGEGFLVRIIVSLEDLRKEMEKCRKSGEGQSVRRSMKDGGDEEYYGLGKTFLKCIP